MPPIAFLLVLFAAVAHCSWNFLAKRAAHSQHLIWFSSVGASLLLLPAVLWILSNAHWTLSMRAVECLAATGILHIFYTECLLRGYRSGHLSVVYPLARGTGPLLAFSGAILLLKERPSALAILGAVLVSCGIFVLTRTTTSDSCGGETTGFAWGLMTGVIIASYTLTDAYSVKVLALSPVLVDCAGNFTRAVALTPRAWRQRGVVSDLRRYWRPSLGIAVLTPGAYLLVLFAMKLAPLTRVAPLREMSVILGAFLGATVLQEGFAFRRVLAAIIIALGVAALTLG